MDFDVILKSKITILVLGVILILVLIITAKLIVQKYEVDKEIKQLQAKADEINRHNLELEQLAKYLNTPEYTERQAREQLNLKKDGEYVVGLPTGSPQEATGQEAEKEGSYFRKWVNYFFKSS